jgi:CTP synthase (UTP-ammonia lyase)
LNPAFQAELVTGPLRATAHDRSSEVRAIELDDHLYVVTTLFQPEWAALKEQLPPLVRAFVAACGQSQGETCRQH